MISSYPIIQTIFIIIVRNEMCLRGILIFDECELLGREWFDLSLVDDGKYKEDKSVGDVRSMQEVEMANFETVQMKIRVRALRRPDFYSGN